MDQKKNYFFRNEHGILNPESPNGFLFYLKINDYNTVALRGQNIEERDNVYHRLWKHMDARVIGKEVD